MLKGLGSADKTELKKSLFGWSFLRWSIVITIPLMIGMSQMGVFGLLSLFLGPWAGYMIADRRSDGKVVRALEAVANLEQRLLKELACDSAIAGYVCVQSLEKPGGIFVDTSNKTLTATTWAGELNRDRLESLPEDCFKTMKFEAHEITRWNAYAPSAALLKAVGNPLKLNSSELLAMHSHNADARKTEREGTGLTIHTNRLDAQEIFINLNYEAAKKWILLLTKFTDGELEPVQSLTEFPAVN